jgi:hypothetical protein
MRKSSFLNVTVFNDDDVVLKDVRNLATDFFNYVLYHYHNNNNSVEAT